MSVALPRSIEAYLRAFERRRRTEVFLRALGRAAALGAAWVLAECLIDRVFHLPGYVRLAVLIAAILSTAGVLVVAAARTLGAAPEWKRLAERIESRDPSFNERLRTVVSQVAEPDRHRGSTEMLRVLADEVARETGQRRRVGFIDAQALARPWTIAGLLGLILACLWMTSRHEMNALAARMFRPLGDVPPVTTVGLSVTPGDVRVPRGSSLAVVASARNHDQAPADLLTSHDGANWSRLVMLPVAEGQFVFTIPSLDHDLYYAVACGDAKSRTFRAAVVRPPALAGYRIRYEYPAYTARGTVEVTRTDGDVQAPRGTRVTLSATSTEPLRSGTLALGEERLSGVVVDPHTLRFAFTLDEAVEGRIDLLSERGVPSASPGVVSVLPVTDRAPVAELRSPGEDLRVAPRERVRVEYTTGDDYGVVAAELRVALNGAPVRTVPVGSGGALDLAVAEWGVEPGDVVTVSLNARDGLGQLSTSTARRLLVAPRTVDEAARRRVAELRQAAEFAAAAVRELQGTYDALSAVRRPRDDPEAVADTGRLRAGAALGSTVERMASLHRSLLRAVAHDAAGTLADALSVLADQARQQLADAERLVALDAAGADAVMVLQEGQGMQAACRALAGAVRTLADGEAADVLLTERMNLQAAAGASPRDGPDSARARQEALDAAGGQLARMVEQAGLRGRSDAELAGVLRGRRDAGTKLVGGLSPVEFEPVANAWVLALVGTARGTPAFAERLTTASSVEALRADGDPIRAYDLRLSAVAATRLQQRASAPARTDAVTEAIADFPRLLGVLAEEHAVRRTTAGAAANPDVVPWAPSTAAAEARDKLREWAGLPATKAAATTPPATAPGSFAAESDELLALRSSYETAVEDHAASAATDRRLAAQARARGTTAEIDPLGTARAAALAAINTAEWPHAARRLHRQRLLLTPSFRLLLLPSPQASTTVSTMTPPRVGDDRTRSGSPRASVRIPDSRPAFPAREASATTRPSAGEFDEALRLYFDAIRSGSTK